MINLTNITLSFGQRDLFRDISLRIDPHARIGLVGRNGAGKTTLLKIIIGQDKPSRGSVNISKDLRVGYMAQDVILKSDKTILNEALSADEHFWKVRTGMQEIEHAIASDTHNPELLEQYVQLQQEYQRLEPHVYEKEVQRVITGMGFAPALWNNPVDSLSVGWKMRLVLAKLLLQRADFYLFDEPTNHLDIIAREWFLRFLKEASFGFVIISHDKFFLNTLCKTIVELENGNGIVYDGNYDDYEVRKEADFEILSTRYKQQQKEIKHTQELIYKFRAKASKAKFAQSLIKQLDSMERIELPPSIKNIAIRLAEPKRSGQMVLTVEGLAYAFGDKQIFKDVSFIIQRGQRVAIIAPNGAGKTTLLNCITGKLTPQKGTVEFGHNVEWVLFDQD
ncbi:MAG: ABC-F family ATP-binding cassette domain-containing protein, partial [Candidatus Babeliales bacterium]